MQRSVLAWLATILLTSTPLASAFAAPSSLHIRVDEFGYRPRSNKVAVIRRPITGYDAPVSYPTPTTIQLRRASDNGLVFSGGAITWKAGATHTASGDKVWWFDFSTFQTPGTYFVIDPVTNARSEDFAIDANVFDPVLRAAVRMYFYQRCGMAKAAPSAEAKWTDTPCHLLAQQDLDCRLVTNPSAATSKDLAGGWHDAGDYNKYVNFADGALHDLLAAYEIDPNSWPDDFGIPESGNGVPDLLDEIRYELTWMLKMQNADGSVLHKVSAIDFTANSPPSTDDPIRRYAPATASATISACGVFARAARAFEARQEVASQTFGATMRAAAIKSWNWLEANPGAIPSNYDNQGFVNADAEDPPYEQQMNRLRAAVQLFRLTNEAKYRTFVDGNYTAAHMFQWTWIAQWEYEIQDGLLAYVTATGATPAVVAAIRNAYIAGMSGPDHLGQVNSNSDAYRAFLPDADHTWGSNRSKSHQGTMYALMNRIGLDPTNAVKYRSAAEDYVHYLHGVNPNGLCYLTNMSALGAEKSVNETYHAWFADGTIYDNAATSAKGPAPGILVGGPNPYFAPDASYSGPLLAPPLNQPVLKSYQDWNTNWPQDSWEVTECHIPYQAGYVRLLAEFSIGSPAALSLDITPSLVSGANASFKLGGCDRSSFVAFLYSTQLGSYTHSDPAWAIDLDLAVLPSPFVYLLFTGNANASGISSWSVFVPPGLSGITLHFQATQAGTSPYPTQSAVITRLLP